MRPHNAAVGEADGITKITETTECDMTETLAALTTEEEEQTAVKEHGHTGK